MQNPSENDLAKIANEMGISLYQRFSIQESALFLRVQHTTVEKLIKQNHISYIQVDKKRVELFGYQLLEYLLNQVKDNTPVTMKPPETSERILRIKEVVHITGLSRTTIWRLENKGTFPRRVSLGGSRVGWRLSEINQWLGTRV